MSHSWLQHYPANIKTEIEIPDGVHIANLIETTCRQYANKVALTCMGTDVSFRQYDRLSSDLASYLQNDLKMKKGDRVAIMLPNVIQFPVALQAAMKIGVICVNTNPLYTAREMRHQFVDSGAKALVIMDLFLDKLEEIIEDTEIEHVIVTSIGDQLPLWKSLLIKTVLKVKGMVPSHNLTVIPFKEALSKGSQSKKYQTPEISLDDIAVLQYTGGTTGVSKGAMLTQRNILANIYQIQEWAKPYILKGDEVILTALPLYHIFALSVNFLAFLTTGGRMILLPKPVPIENTVKAFKKYKITVMTGVNTLFNALNNSKAFQAVAPRDLKVALAGGMALQQSVAKEFQSITGTQVIEGFGLTEASPVTHCNPMHTVPPKGSIGLPLPSTNSKVLDEAGNEVPIGEVGELCIQGPQVMKGYWQRSDETDKTIKDGWLWTGDMAKQDEDGYFFIVDRKKDMILVSGFNVYPNEVEDVLASHPKVLEAAVIGIPSDSSGEKVKAFVVKKDDSLTESELKAYCEKNLTGYKRPRAYEFKDELPKSNVGKILRRELRDQEPASA
ncbi:AMP-binding protein [Pseudobacteriovorax antillogorgiicola]|uniref:Long-chain-fatty-acid--CoA ligase n=1 Tax=Pseudobacteriovorax antillogorgiicola TaxID=1513793 RepID=A0A1Y6CJH6_9BACT|nr:AMP-binding protein [Pseudobacteriovorax antillogorgiicola]TCS46168.1 long-chain acyl-CoA synthetase [Pseudobacteriovorax antillogorgiicola]SMF69953.1 long-chain acyl-CoA synthetase [Pseudobacteriovorax antillogorgiicola]